MKTGRGRGVFIKPSAVTYVDIRKDKMKWGGVSYLSGIEPKDIERFNSLFTKNGPDDCWPWRRECHGYPSFGVRGRSLLGHRLAWALHNRAEPGRSYVCHSCDNPKCVNPAHLHLGSQKQNQQERRSRYGAFRWAVGQRGANVAPWQDKKGRK